MGKNKTSAIFYRRGIPNNNYGFGGAVLGNYSIVEPTSLFFRFPRQSFTRPPGRRLDGYFLFLVSVVN